MLRRKSMADAQERIGQSVGDYRLLRLLGKGTFGTVYLARHADDHSPAAVKLFHIPLTGRNALRAFLNEARTVRLRHPHIVPILDFGLSHNDLPYLVMAYANRGSLRDRYPKGYKLSHETIDTYVQQLASALQYAHNCHIIHRDVKPENMLMPSDGTVQLSDFGIAKISELASISTQYTIVGTPAYAAPEQSQGQPCPASDQYALAIVVYEWLAGQRPFQGDPFALTLHHHRDTPPSLRSTCPEVSLQVEQVIFKALAKAPQDRFPTITDFAQALHAALQKGAEATQPLSHPDKNRSVSSPNNPVPTPDAPNMITVPSTAPLVLAEASPSPQSIFASPPRAKFARRMARRTILAGLVALGGVGAAITWFTLTQTQKPHLGTLLYTYHGHPATVMSVMWSPDGKRIASTSADYTVQVWDAFTGDHVVTHSGHNAGVTGAVWSPDGKRIASASYDGTVQVWNATTGGGFFTCTHHNGITALALSPNGKYIASGSSDGTVQIWEATTGNHLLTYTGNAGWVYGLAWSPDSTHIVSGTNHGRVQIWVPTTGTNILSYPGHGTSLVHTLAWSPQGDHIASGGEDMTVQVWNATTGKTNYTYEGHTNRIYNVAWSPDSKRIASASADRTAHIWDAFNGDHVYVYHGHVGFVQGVTWSPNGQYIATASSDTTVQVWQAT
jgi:eukaryotic-like serine/threonine-protein kinase